MIKELHFSIKRILSVIVCLCVAGTTVLTANATSKSEIERQKREAENQLNSVNSAINSIAGQQDAIDEEIQEMDNQLVELMASISIMEEEIEEKEEQIVITKEELAEAEEREEEQYVSMKLRIKFMYEKGDSNYLELFMQAKSLNEAMNKADYIEKLYAYDRKLLAEYVAVKEEVALRKDTLETEQSELESAKYECEEETKVLNAAIAEKEAVSDNFAVQLAQARQEAAVYKTQIQQQNAQLKAIEEAEARAAAEAAAKKAAEEAAKKASEKKDTNSSSTSSGSSSNNTNKGSFDSSNIYAASGSGSGKEIAAFACQYIGYPYVAGGTSLTEGADCSGFTQAVYRAFGYSIPRSSSSQRSAGREVSYAEAEPGDLICYAGHVALYIGNGQIVHASTVKTGIKTGNALYREILSVRRIIG